MKKTMLAMMLLAGGSLFAAPRIAVGVNIGVGAPVAMARPACPGPGYVWIDGYYAPNGGFVAGYWSLPPAAGAYWVAPHYEGPRFVTGYWGHGVDRGPVIVHDRGREIAPNRGVDHGRDIVHNRGNDRGRDSGRGHDNFRR